MEEAYREQPLPNALHGAWLERAGRIFGRRRVVAGEALAPFPFAIPFGAHADLRGDRGWHEGRQRLKGVGAHQMVRRKAQEGKNGRGREWERRKRWIFGICRRQCAAPR